MALPTRFRKFVWDGIDPTEAVLLFDNPPASYVTGDPYAMATTKVDWMETRTEHVIKVGMPGLKKEEVNVQIEYGRTLLITGQRMKEELQNTDTWQHRAERSRVYIMRKFTLPENAKVDVITAMLDSDVLTVVVPIDASKKEIVNVKIDGIGGDGDQQATEKIDGIDDNSDQQAAAIEAPSRILRLRSK